MPLLDKLVQGQEVLIDESFYDGVSPFAATSAAIWVIIDSNNNPVMNGVASQDINNPQRWHATITIPSAMPEARYSLQWEISNDKKTLSKSQSFTVTAPLGYDILELDRLQTEKSALVDSIAIDDSLTVTALTVRLLTDSNSEIFTSGPITLPNANVTQVNTSGKKIYTYASPTIIEGMVASAVTFKPFIIEWAYTINGAQNKEYHFLYVVSLKGLTYTNMLRRFIDKAKFSHPNPNLRYTDVDLVAFLDMGVQLVNFAKPILTRFTVSNFPDTLDMGLLNAAAYCALSSQYIAEGQSAFNFNGQSISLEIDRTQAIDAALQRCMTFIETQLPTAKRMWLRSTGGTGSGAGVLGINLGPSTNYTGGSRLRYDRYRGLLNS